MLLTQQPSINGFVHQVGGPVFELFDRVKGLFPAVILIIFNAFLLYKIVVIVKGVLVSKHQMQSTTNDWFKWEDFKEWQETKKKGF